MTIEDAEKELAAARGRCDELELRLFKLGPKIAQADLGRTRNETAELSRAVVKLERMIQRMRMLCAEMQASIEQEKVKALDAPKEETR